MSKRCLVSGAAGFIGSHLCERLLADGHTVTAIDDLSSGRRANLKSIRRRIRFIAGDLAKIGDWMRLPLVEFDWVFHLAAKAAIVPSIEKPWDYHGANVTGTLAALQCARACHASRFIYAASSSCYGLATELPTPETAAIDCQYPYALTKWMGEQYALHWMRVYGLPVVSLRLFNVYGPRQQTSTYGAVFGVFLSQKAQGQPLTVIGDGTQARDFTYVTDVVDAFVKAAESDITGVFNVGSGYSHSVNELADLIGGPRVSIAKRAGEPELTWANATKFSYATGWVPKIHFEGGVAELIDRLDDYREHVAWTPETIAAVTASWHQYLK